jgi:hypothetical protein
VAQQRHPRAGYGSGYGYSHGGGYGHGYGGGSYRGGHSYYGHGSYRPYYGHRRYYPYSPYYSSYYPYGYSYYPYSYAPYYGSYWPGVSLSFGWGYGSSGYDASDDYRSPVYSVGVAEPYAAARDDGGASPPPVRDAVRSYEGPTGRVRLEVRPDDTSVYVDDEFRGTAREARILRLPPGRHAIELVRPGFTIEHREVTVVSGGSQDVLVELLRP